jgi:hypothetical protein
VCNRSALIHTDRGAYPPVGQRHFKAPVWCRTRRRSTYRVDTAMGCASR